MALSGPPTAVGAFCIGLVDVDAMVEEPVNVFARNRVIPGYIRQVSWTCIIHLKAILAYVLQNQVSVNADIQPELREEFDQIERLPDIISACTSSRVGTMLEQQSH